MTKRIGMLGVGVALLFATAARAQISSPPTLQGEPAVHAWSVPGVVSSSNLATLFSCTNALTIPGSRALRAGGRRCAHDGELTGQ